jgi:hypothetical protein
MSFWVTAIKHSASGQAWGWPFLSVGTDEALLGGAGAGARRTVISRGTLVAILIAPTGPSRDGVP